MSKMKTIGIIGGMGPMATVDLMKKVILATDAREDQDHIPILVDNNTNIPDRTAAILGKGESPLPELMKSANRLTDAGADFLIMGCNTAHYFLPLMMPNLRIPVINMIEETAAFCAREGYKRVGLLASAGTCKSGIYQRALERAGVEVVQPQGEAEDAIHGMIYDGVKAGNMGYDTTAVRERSRRWQPRAARPSCSAARKCRWPSRCTISRATSSMRRKCSPRRPCARPVPRSSRTCRTRQPAVENDSDNAPARLGHFLMADICHAFGKLI